MVDQEATAQSCRVLCDGIKDTVTDWVKFHSVTSRLLGRQPAGHLPSDASSVTPSHCEAGASHDSEPPALCRGDLPVASGGSCRPLTRFSSDSAYGFSSANTTLLLLALFLDLRSLTSGRVLPGEMGSSCSTFGVLGGAISRSKLNGKKDSSRDCS